MELQEFFEQTRARVQSDVAERMQDSSEPYPHEETVFAEIVMQHMADVGITEEPVICHYAGKVGNSNLRMTGYSISQDGTALDLFVSLYDGSNELSTISETDTKNAAGQCLQFLSKCAEGKLAAVLDETHEAYPFVLTIEGSYRELDQIRIYVLTDRIAKAKNFKPRDVRDKTIGLEVMDIERLHRHWAAGKPRDELVVNFEEISGSPLPCVYVPGQLAGYDYALTAIPGEALRALYEKFGPRLLEANVRAFLSDRIKVNKGIRETLRDEPEHFMAFNNGVVLVADEARIVKSDTGVVGLAWLKGMQIVNGGQTTASLYFAKKKTPEIDLSRVRVPAKIIIIQSSDADAEEQLIADISRFANSQTAVKMSDHSANKPFHVQFEKLANSVFCPDGVGRWFYERAAGSYNVLLSREGTTPARLRNLKEAIPPARKISKTDLAKYLTAWECRPDLVSLGSQKNFERFMDHLSEDPSTVPDPLDVVWFKKAIAKAILFKAVHKMARPKFKQAQANIAAYVVSLLAFRLGDQTDLDRIWLRQGISKQLSGQLEVWAVEMERALIQDANGRMISEQAKRPECWHAVRDYSFSKASNDIPEFA